MGSISRTRPEFASESDGGLRNSVNLGPSTVVMGTPFRTGHALPLTFVTFSRPQKGAGNSRNVHRVDAWKSARQATVTSAIWTCLDHDREPGDVSNSPRTQQLRNRVHVCVQSVATNSVSQHTVRVQGTSTRSPRTFRSRNQGVGWPSPRTSNGQPVAALRPRTRQLCSWLELTYVLV